MTTSSTLPRQLAEWMNFHSITRVALPTTLWLLKQKLLADTNGELRILRGHKISYPYSRVRVLAQNPPGQVYSPLIFDDDDVVGRGLSALHDEESLAELITSHWAHGRQLREQIQVPERWKNQNIYSRESDQTN